jgi:hypothetical protein
MIPFTTAASMEHRGFAFHRCLWALFIGGVCTIGCFDHATGQGLFAFVENMSSDKARGNPIFGDLSVTYYNYSGIACNYTLLSATATFTKGKQDGFSIHSSSVQNVEKPEYPHIAEILTDDAYLQESAGSSNSSPSITAPNHFFVRFASL